jgi:hypothetical protein
LGSSFSGGVFSKARRIVVVGGWGCTGWLGRDDEAAMIFLLPIGTTVTSSILIFVKGLQSHGSERTISIERHFIA